jgi:hypothetical protein
MTGAPTISVVIPCFDYEQFVGAAIESVRASTRAADEIVVVDDGSRDGSAAVVAAHEGVTLVRKDNGGMASALNRGITESHGDIVVLLDADDLMDPTRLAWVEEAFEDDGVAMAWHPLVVRSDSGDERGILPSTPLPSGDLVPGILAHGFVSFAVTSGVAVRRSALDAMGPIPEDDFRNFAESFVVRAAPFHGSVASTAEPLGTYRVHGGSDMRQALSSDPDAMAAKLASRLRMADTEQRHLCDLASDAGHRLTPGDLHSHDAVYRDLYLAHARLVDASRRSAWRRARALDLGAASRSVRLGTLVRAAVYVALPRSVVARHQLVRSGSGDADVLTRVWSKVYWRTKGLLSGRS